MADLNRRGMLAAAAGGLTTAAAAKAETMRQPIRGADGAAIIGPVNPARQAEEPFTTAPPATDHGTMPNLKWSFTDSHMRLEEGGWPARSPSASCRSRKPWPA